MTTIAEEPNNPLLEENITDGLFVSTLPDEYVHKSTKPATAVSATEHSLTSFSIPIPSLPEMISIANLEKNVKNLGQTPSRRSCGSSASGEKPNETRFLQEEDLTPKKESKTTKDSSSDDCQEKNSGYYAVRKGKNIRHCIFMNWHDCEPQVDDYPGTEYSFFDNFEDAINFTKGLPDNSGTDTRKRPRDVSLIQSDKTIKKRSFGHDDDSLPVRPVYETPLKEDKNASNTSKTNKIGDDDYFGCYNVSDRKPVQKWMQNYNELKNFLLENGHDHLKKVGPYSRLYRWTRDQVYEYKRLKERRPLRKGVMVYTMTKDKIKLMEDIGFNFAANGSRARKDLRKAIWVERFKDFTDFCKKNGGTWDRDKCNDLRLKNWVLTMSRQIQKHLAGRSDVILSPGQIENIRPYLCDLKPCFPHIDTQATETGSKEESVGQKFTHQAEKWETNYKHALEYFQKHGSLAITKEQRNSDDAKRIKLFLDFNYKHYKKFLNKEVTIFDEDKLDRLKEIGFYFGRRWEKNLEKLKDFRAEHGYTDIPEDHPSGLNRWVQEQKDQCQRFLNGSKSSCITEERFNQLCKLGINFESEVKLKDEDKVEQQSMKWMEMFERLRVYKEKHNTPTVLHTHDRNLGNWVREQRIQHEKAQKGLSSKLTAARREHLDNLGFNYEPRHYSWEERITQLKQYKEEHDHLRIPSKFGNESNRLGKWVVHCRTLYKAFQEGKENSLSDSKIKELEDIGFVWKIGKQLRFKPWIEQYKTLIKYKEKYGDTLVPQNHPQDTELGWWVKKQRSNYKDWLAGKPGPFSEFRFKKLQEVGFVFQLRARRAPKKHHSQGNGVNINIQEEDKESNQKKVIESHNKVNTQIEIKEEPLSHDDGKIKESEASVKIKNNVKLIEGEEDEGEAEKDEIESEDDDDDDDYEAINDDEDKHNIENKNKLRKALGSNFFNHDGTHLDVQQKKHFVEQQILNERYQLNRELQGLRYPFLTHEHLPLAVNAFHNSLQNEQVMIKAQVAEATAENAFFTEMQNQNFAAAGYLPQSQQQAAELFQYQKQKFQAAPLNQMNSPNAYSNMDQFRNQPFSWVYPFY